MIWGRKSLNFGESKSMPKKHDPIAAIIVTETTRILCFFVKSNPLEAVMVGFEPKSLGLPHAKIILKTIEETMPPIKAAKKLSKMRPERHVMRQSRKKFNRIICLLRVKVFLNRVFTSLFPSFMISNFIQKINNNKDFEHDKRKK